MSLLCACTDAEMCNDCKRVNEISKAYEQMRRQLLRDWNSHVDRMIADYFSVESDAKT